MGSLRTFKINMQQPKKEKSIALQVSVIQSNNDEKNSDIDEYEALVLLIKNLNKVIKRMGHKSKPSQRVFRNGKSSFKFVETKKNKEIQ